MSSKTITQNDLTNILNEIFPATSDDMTPAQIEDFVQSLNAVATSSVDYIVEQGQEGIWTYRKWNSGIAECWGSNTYTNLTFGAQGNLYFSAIANISLPSGLFSQAPIVLANCVFGAVGGARTGSITTTQFNTAIYSGTSGTYDVELQFNVKGTWK